MSHTISIRKIHIFIFHNLWYSTSKISTHSSYDWNFSVRIIHTKFSHLFTINFFFSFSILQIIIFQICSRNSTIIRLLLASRRHNRLRRANWCGWPLQPFNWSLHRREQRRRRRRLRFPVLWTQKWF